MFKRRNQEYKEGELETILSLVPTVKNIKWLSQLLDRSEAAIKIVYQIAYGHGPFGKNADIQEQKIIAAKIKVGIDIGRKKPRAKKVSIGDN